MWFFCLNFGSVSIGYEPIMSVKYERGEITVTYHTDTPHASDIERLMDDAILPVLY